MGKFVAKILAIEMVILLAALTWISYTAHAQTYELAPQARLQFLDANGNPLASGKLRTCTAGSTCNCSTGTGLATYSDNSGTPNANPVVLDSAGRATVYLGASAYQFALCTSANVSVWTQDNISAVGLAALANFNHTTNTIPKFGGSSTLTTSQITDTGSKINLGTANSITADLIIARDGSHTVGVSQAAADGSGTTINGYKSRGSHASPSNVINGDNLFAFQGQAYSGSTFFAAGGVQVSIDGTFTSGQAPPSRVIIYTNTANGSNTEQLRVGSTGLITAQRSINVGAPTGGDKGVGTVNLQGDIYKNNTAYTNPDYVFEHYYSGSIVKFKSNPGANHYTGLMSLTDVESYAKVNYQLPDVGSTHGMFERGDILLRHTEELYLHMFELQHKIDSLEARLSALESRN